MKIQNKFKLGNTIHVCKVIKDDSPETEQFKEIIKSSRFQWHSCTWWLVSFWPQLRLFVFVLMYILWFCFIFMWWKYFTREPFYISVILHTGILTSVYGSLACKVLYFSLSFLSPLYETGSSWQQLFIIREMVFMTDDKTLHLYKSIYIFSGGKKEGNFHRSKKKGN